MRLHFMYGCTGTVYVMHIDLLVPRKNQAVLAEEGLPCVLIACNCGLMENTNATCKKAAHLRLTGTVILSRRQSQAPHNGAHSSTHQASDQQGVINHKLRHNLAP